MDREDFIRRLPAELRHLTWEERENVRQEIEGHMEDRIEGLEELGCPRETAEERTLSAMGSPTEIGRELDQQYPPEWLWIGRAAFLLTLVLCLQALLSIGMLGFFWDSVTARFDPPEVSRLQSVAAYTPLDIKIPVGNDILRITRVAVGRHGNWPGELTAEVCFCAYDRIPGGIVSRSLSYAAELRNQRGERSGGSGGRGHTLLTCKSIWVLVQPGDTYVTFSYDLYGEQFFLELPLPELEEAEP